MRWIAVAVCALAVVAGAKPSNAVAISMTPSTLLLPYRDGAGAVDVSFVAGDFDGVVTELVLSVTIAVPAPPFEPSAMLAFDVPVLSACIPAIPAGCPAQAGSRGAFIVDPTTVAVFFSIASEVPGASQNLFLELAGLPGRASFGSAGPLDQVADFTAVPEPAGATLFAAGWLLVSRAGKRARTRSPRRGP